MAFVTRSSTCTFLTTVHNYDAMSLENLEGENGLDHHHTLYAGAVANV